MTAMEGGGRYNAHASAQAASAEFALDLVREAARTAPIGPDGTVTVADYGASEGRNSLAPMGAAVDTLRQVHGEGQPIRVVHTDLPDNDFSSLFHVVAEDPDTYRRPGVYPAAIGRSFYEQLLPSGSVGLGWSSIAVHWLGTVPGALDGFWPGDATGQQAAAWGRAAASDWSAFLTARSAELRSGARLVIVSGAAYDGEPRRSGAERVMDEVARGLATLVDRGMLSAAERDAMVVPAWYRTEAEWRAPFTAGLGLELERFESVDLGDPLWLRHGDGADYARAAAAAIRVSFGQPLLQGLEPSRREEVAAALFDEHLADAIATGPSGPWFAWRLAVMCAARR